MKELKQAATRKPGVLATVKAVGASFFGVRGGKAHAHDVSRLNPVVVIAVGVALAAAFVVVLVFAARIAAG